MNILVYIPWLNQEDGGIRQYSIGLLKLLARDLDNQYLVYHNVGDIEVLDVVAKNSKLRVLRDADVVIEESSYLAQKIRGLKNRIARRFKIGKERSRISFIDILCAQFEIDIIHCPYQYIPNTGTARLITTLHDVQEIHFPEYFSAETRAYRSTAYLDFMRRSDAIIVSYEHVKNDLVQYFNVPTEKIEVLLLKMDNLWFDRFSNGDITDLSPLNLPAKFFLYPANTWKHKNHLRLIEAVAIARDKYKIFLNLICTGHTNEHFQEIENLIRKLNLNGQIMFTGVVEEQDLYSLYKTCHGVVIPTTYEAGSFPLYESILLNVPVICSNVTSLPETIGNKNFIFDPFKAEEIAQKMLNLWNDEAFRADNLTQLETQAQVIRKSDPLALLQSIYTTLNA